VWGGLSPTKKPKREKKASYRKNGFGNMKDSREVRIGDKERISVLEGARVYRGTNQPREARKKGL